MRLNSELTLVKTNARYADAITPSPMPLIGQAASTAREWSNIDTSKVRCCVTVRLTAIPKLSIKPFVGVTGLKPRSRQSWRRNFIEGYLLMTKVWKRLKKNRPLVPANASCSSEDPHVPRHQQKVIMRASALGAVINAASDRQTNRCEALANNAVKDAA